MWRRGRIRVREAPFLVFWGQEAFCSLGASEILRLGQKSARLTSLFSYRPMRSIETHSFCHWRQSKQLIGNEDYGGETTWSGLTLQTVNTEQETCRSHTDFRYIIFCAQLKKLHCSFSVHIKPRRKALWDTSGFVSWKLSVWSLWILNKDYFFWGYQHHFIFNLSWQSDVQEQRGASRSTFLTLFPRLMLHHNTDKTLPQTIQLFAVTAPHQHLRTKGQEETKTWCLLPALKPFGLNSIITPLELSHFTIFISIQSLE